MRLLSKRAVVTGASSGIGRAIACAFAREGARVIVNYRRTDSAAKACVAEIERLGGEAIAMRADISEPADIDRLVEGAVDALGGIDIWANVAGADILTGAGAALDDDDKLEWLIRVDLLGTIRCCWAAQRILQQGVEPSIINMSWDLALRGMAGKNPQMFAAVKAGVTGFTRSYALSVAPRIRVNEIAPGWIATAFAEDEMTDAYRANVIAQTPLNRFGVPDDIAGAAVYLASQEAAFLTGQTIKVNGGLSS